MVPSMLRNLNQVLIVIAIAALTACAANYGTVGNLRLKQLIVIDVLDLGLATTTFTSNFIAGPERPGRFLERPMSALGRRFQVYVHEAVKEPLVADGGVALLDRVDAFVAQRFATHRADMEISLYVLPKGAGIDASVLRLTYGSSARPVLYLSEESLHGDGALHLVGSLSHELVHVYARLGLIEAGNMTREEDVAHAMETCAQFDILQRTLGPGNYLRLSEKSMRHKPKNVVERSLLSQSATGYRVQAAIGEGVLDADAPPERQQRFRAFCHESLSSARR